MCFMKEIQNVKRDVKTEAQRSHRSVSYPHQHRSSKSKQRCKKLGWKVSSLKQGSDSPTFLTAQPCSWQTGSSPFHPAEQISSKGELWWWHTVAATAQGHTSFRKGSSCTGLCVSLSSGRDSRVHEFCFSHLKTQ